MAQFSFDAALGREVELYNRVNDGDPLYAAFVLVVLANAGLEQDSVLRTYDNLYDLLFAGNNEVTNTGYSRIVIDGTGLDPYTVDTINHEITLPLADQTFTSIGVGDSWRKLLICYDPDSGTGTDADILPVCAHDILVNGVAAVPNGNNILIGFGNGILIAS